MNSTSQTQRRPELRPDMGIVWRNGHSSTYSVRRPLSVERPSSKSIIWVIPIDVTPLMATWTPLSILLISDWTWLKKDEVFEVTRERKQYRQLIVLLSFFSILGLLLQSIHFHGPKSFNHEDGNFAGHHGCCHSSAEDRHDAKSVQHGLPQIESIERHIGCPICLTLSLNPFGVSLACAPTCQFLHAASLARVLRDSQQHDFGWRASHHSRAPPFLLV